MSREEIEMKAKMKDHLVARYEKALPGELGACAGEDARGRMAFLESIEKKEVDLVFTGGDAFEKEYNNIWLPDSLWEQI